mgnify:CR=1 FL=1
MYVETIHRTAIRRMQVYVNSEKKTLTEIVAEEQPDIALTGVFYDPNRWSPVCPVKSDGKVLFADPQYTYQALGWSAGPDVAQIAVPPGGGSAADSYVANCILVNGGFPQRTLYYGDDVGALSGCGLCLYDIFVDVTRRYDYVEVGARPFADGGDVVFSTLAVGCDFGDAGVDIRFQRRHYQFRHA